MENGYRPLLAHPERMPLDEATFRTAIEQTLATGAVLQGNLHSLAGGEGDTAAARSRTLLAEGRYHVLASDTHRPAQVPGRAAGLAVAAEIAGGRRGADRSPSSVPARSSPPGERFA